MTDNDNDNDMTSTYDDLQHILTDLTEARNEETRAKELLRKAQEIVTAATIKTQKLEKEIAKKFQHHLWGVIGHLRYWSHRHRSYRHRNHRYIYQSHRPHRHLKYHRLL